MKKLITKRLGITAGLAIAIGVGAGIALANSKKAEPVYADDFTYSFTINTNDFSSSSYADNNNEKSSTATCTTDDSKTMEVSWTSNQVMKNGDDMQWQKSNGYIYNSTDLGTVNSVTVTSSEGTFTTYYGAEEQPDSGAQGANKGYFKTKVGGATGKTTSIVVNFTISEASGLKVSYNANGGTGNMSDPNSPYEEDDTVTILDNVFTRSGYVFDHWDTKADDSGTDYDEGDTFTISGNVTLYAQWILAYTVSYDANGGTGTMTDSSSPYKTGSIVTIKENTFTRSGYLFTKWNTAADGKGIYYDEGDTFAITANVTLYAQWMLDDLTDRTGTINFGSASSSTPIKASSCLGKDNLGLIWSITVADNTGDNYSQNASYSQIGVGTTNNAEKWASSVTLTATLPETYKVTAFSVRVGGFSDTTGSISLKVGSTEVGSGSFNKSTDVTAEASTTNEKGTVLTIVLTGGASGRFRLKVYSISYTLASPLETQTITAGAEYAYVGDTISLTTNATSATWSITANTADASLSATSGKSINVGATQEGSVTVQAVASGYTTVTKTLTFLVGTYYDVTFNSNGGSESPSNEVVEDGHTFVFPSAGTKEHYSFDGWTSTGSAPYYAAGATSPAVKDDITYTAHWTEDAKYTITYSAGDNGSGSYADANHYGGTYTLLTFNSLDGVAADSGYRFKDYTVGGVHKNPGDTFTLSANTNVTVNFEEIPLEYVVTFGTAEASGQLANFSNTSYVIPSGITLDNIQGNLYSNNENEAAAIRFGKSGTTGSFDVSIDNNYYIKKIIANLKYYGTDTTAEFAITPEDGEPIGKTLTSSPANYEYDISASCASKATLGTTIAGKRAFLSGFTIVYDLKTTEQKVETNNKTLSALKFTYEETAGDYSITNAAIRFGGFISQELWSELEDVEGYGVVIASASSLGSDSIKDKYNAKKVVFAADANDDNDDVDSILNAICSDLSAKKASASGANPAYANDEQKTFMGVELLDSYRVWTSKKEISESDFATQYTSVAYIKIDGDIIFLKETTTSFKDLAVSRQDTLDPSDPAFGAIEYIAGNY